MQIHRIEPVFDENSKVLVLGSFPSPKSREQGFYYGHPRNRMWKVLAEVFGEVFPETPSSRRDFLLKHNIAMWDVLAACEITGASDASILREIPNDLRRIFECADIAAVYTTGTAAANFYKKYDENLFPVPHCKLPSTSPANAAMTLSQLVEAYSVLKTRIPE